MYREQYGEMLSCDGVYKLKVGVISVSGVNFFGKENCLLNIFIVAIYVLTLSYYEEKIHSIVEI